MSMSFKSNLYYNPEDFDLTVVGEVDAGEAYQFNTVCVWQDKDGQLYYASDEGCSCPAPFENFNNLADLTPLVSLSEFKDAMRGTGASLSDRLDLLRAVEALQ